MRSVWSLLTRMKSALAGIAAPGSPSPSTLPPRPDADALWRDGGYFWNEMQERPDAVRRAMYERYPLISRAYVDRYLDHIRDDLPLNPLAPLYIESELGAPARQLTLLAELEGAGLRLPGRNVLDIGCSNGSLLLAARTKGASRCVGVDVSEARISAARTLVEGSGVEVMVHDLAAADLPGGYGPFEAIFCTDVLEHVSSIPRMLEAMSRHLARSAEARVFVTVFNHLNASCVASEPHYGVPGMVLVDRDAAAEIWTAVRGQLRSTLDYEVERWPEYHSLTALARGAGLEATPLVNPDAVIDGRPPFWSGYEPRLQQLEAAAAARLEELTMSGAHRGLLRDGIRDYCREALEQHRAFEAQLPQARDEDIIGFYLRYYAQPLRFFLAHAP